VFLAYGVTLLSLLIPTFSLQFLVEKLGVTGGDENGREEAIARLRISDSVIENLAQWEGANDEERDHISGLLAGYRRQRDSLAPTVLETPYSEIDFDRLLKKDRLVKLLRIERQELGELRRTRRGLPPSFGRIRSRGYFEAKFVEAVSKMP
jgi:NhaP-type Na+/H+ or K+/H+ antiporter